MQGWDLHPAQLPTRHAAVIAHFLEGRDEATARLRALRGAAPPGRALHGDAVDDVATGQGLLNFFLRGSPRARSRGRTCWRRDSRSTSCARATSPRILAARAQPLRAPRGAASALAERPGEREPARRGSRSRRSGVTAPHSRTPLSASAYRLPENSAMPATNSAPARRTPPPAGAPRRAARRTAARSRAGTGSARRSRTRRASPDRAARAARARRRRPARPRGTRAGRPSRVKFMARR